MIDVRKSIGSMERRITVKSTGAASGVDVIDTFGHPQKTWADLFTCWAAREAATGTANQEQQTANRTIYPGSYTYYMHYQGTVTEDMRLTDDGVDYDITLVEPVDGKKFLALTVEKVIE
jgi:SPP1 family predicted phage head-tail adaptor